MGDCRIDSPLKLLSKSFSEFARLLFGSELARVLRDSIEDLRTLRTLDGRSLERNNRSQCAPIRFGLCTGSTRHSHRDSLKLYETSRNELSSYISIFRSRISVARSIADNVPI